LTRQLILGTAGHIDHGKTSLVRALTGVDTDRLPQEKARGITIDLGFADLTVGDTHFGIIDVPGHERFVKNMLAGAAGIDVALLVVAADDSVMPQTREHLAIMQLLGIQRGVIAITKSDLADPDWLAMVEDDIRALTRSTFLERAPIIRTSASTGLGLDDLQTALLNAAPAPAATEPETAPAPAPFRLAIDRAFVLEGRGTVVTGTVSSGEARIGDDLELMPAARPVRIRALHTHGHETDHITRAQRAAINLAGVHHEEVTRGHELCVPGLLTPTRRITARLHILPDAPHPLRHRASVRLHLGTRETIASVRLLQGLEIQPGANALAQLVCHDPIVCQPGQPLVLRSESPVTTIGGGRVLDPVARHVSRRDHTRHERIAQLDHHDASTRLAAVIALADSGAMTRGQAARAAAIPQDHASILLDELKASGEIAHIKADLIADTQRLQAMTRAIERALSALHEAAPLEPRHQRSRLQQQLAYIPPEILDALCNHLLETGVLTGDQEAVALGSFKPALPPALLSAVPAIIERYRAAAFRPPSTDEIATDVGASPREITKLIDLLTTDGTLIHIGGGMRLHGDNETKLKRTITDLIHANSSGVTTSQIKDALNTTRKYAIPICEYLDRIRLTRRIGDLRVLVE